MHHFAHFISSTVRILVKLEGQYSTVKVTGWGGGWGIQRDDEVEKTKTADKRPRLVNDILYNGSTLAPPPQRCPYSWRDFDPRPSDTRFLGPTEVSFRNVISIGSSLFA